MKFLFTLPVYNKVTQADEFSVRSLTNFVVSPLSHRTVNGTLHLYNSEIYILFSFVILEVDSKPDIMNNLENIKSLIRPILKKYGIKKAGIFGSSARGESVVNDLDLLVKIDKKISLLEFIGIQQELEDTLGMKVDLVEYDAIKPALKDEILQDEKPVL